MRRFLRRVGEGQALSYPPQPASLKLWTSANIGVFADTGLTTPQTTDGGLVGGWRDRSRAGNNATQGAAADQPVFRAAGINGHPAIQFTAANTQWLNVDTLAASFSGTNLPATIVTALQLANTTAECVLGIANSGSNSRLQSYVSTAVNGWRSLRSGDTGTNATITGGTPDTSPHIVEWVSTGTTMQIFVDGVSVAGPSAQSVNAMTVNVAEIGAINIAGVMQLFLSALIGDLYVYSLALGATDRATIRRHLGAKYGIATQ